MTKKKIIILLAMAAVLVTAGISVAMSGVLDSYERQVQMAYKLLSEGKYEEAILAFDKAIEIDVKRDKAYIGKADVYVTRCDENTLEDTQRVLEIGYNQHYNDQNFVNAFIRLSDELFMKEYTDWAIELLDFGFNLTNDETLREHKNILINKIAVGFLEKLYIMFEDGEDDSIRAEIQSDKYLDFMNLIDGADYKYIYFPDENKEQTGKGIALYYVNSARFGNLFAYYGDFIKGIRSGAGTWVGANKEQSYWFEGSWHEDKPNGKGSITTIMTPTEKIEGHTYALKTYTDGEFTDGLYNGNINETWYMDNGQVMEWETIVAVNGVYSERSSIPDFISDADYAKERAESGEYLVAIEKNNDADLWSSGNVNAIEGFGVK